MATSSNKDPKTLFETAMGGDPSALGQLLELYRAYLKTLANAKLHATLRGKVDASDVVQETCMEAVRTISSFRGSTPTEFAGWLRGILAHRISKTVRRYLGTQQRNIQIERSMRQDLDASSDNLERFIATNEDSPSQVLEWSETVLQLANAIESLPEDYRKVVMLRNVQDRPFREVANEMGRSIDSVEKLWVRALAKLKELIGERPRVLGERRKPLDPSPKRWR
jgi:RNA polymerase sigma-70 factor, ECF subfamily